jgi:purine nucleosidase
VQKIIIDCDPGIDDAVAIFLALASRDDIEVLGVTCVNGNVGLDKTHMNARRIVTAAQRLDIPVLRGIPRPILAPASLASSSHGLDGLGDIASVRKISGCRPTQRKLPCYQRGG